MPPQPKETQLGHSLWPHNNNRPRLVLNYSTLYSCVTLSTCANAKKDKPFYGISPGVCASTQDEVKHPSVPAGQAPSAFWQHPHNRILASLAKRCPTKLFVMQGFCFHEITQTEDRAGLSGSPPPPPPRPPSIPDTPVDPPIGRKVGLVCWRGFLTPASAAPP